MWTGWRRTWRTRRPSASPACRGCGWRRRACRCRAAGPCGAGCAARPGRGRAPWRSGRVVGHAARVVERVRRLRVDDLGEGLRDAVEALVVRHQDDVVRRQVGGRRLVLAEPPPQLVAVGEAEQRVGQPGSNQRPRRSRSIRRTPSTPRSWWKTSTVCATHAMRARIGIASPFSPSGWPLPFQCSSSERTAAAAAAGNSTCARSARRARSGPRRGRRCRGRARPPPARARPARRSGEACGATAVRA